MKRIRVIGRASISTDPALLESFIFAGKTPRSVIVVAVETVYFQCAKALIRSRLWDPARHVARASLPSNGTILAATTKGEHGGEAYDREYPERLKATIYLSCTAEADRPIRCGACRKFAEKFQYRAYP